jgi:hypothetical protein
VKYQVNLYRERLQRAAVVRRGILRGSVLGGLVGLDLLLIGFLVISGFQMRARARDLQATINAARTEAKPAAETRETTLARKIAETRLGRVDWSVVLGAVASALPNDLILTRIDAGNGSSRGTLDGMNLEGRLLGNTHELNSVIDFMQALRDSSSVSAQFPLVDLGTAGGQGLQAFEVVLRKTAPKPAPKTEGLP